MKAYIWVLADYAWMIEPGAGVAVWLLNKRGTDSNWIPVAMYRTPECAAKAVAERATGDPAWDSRAPAVSHEAFPLARWIEQDIAAAGPQRKPRSTLARDMV